MIPDTDNFFAGPLPKIYDAYLVPLIFQVYADDLVDRVKQRSPSRVLEIGCGTGVVTRGLSSSLPRGTSIVASDMNQPMLDHASGVGTRHAVEWRRADAMQLPFDDATFDAVVCQFAVMFFPDKLRAFSEVRRVLRPGGVFIFSTWDRIEENGFADTVTTALASMFPEDPPRFLARTPHGYHDIETITRDVVASGAFDVAPRIDTVPALSLASSPRVPAIAYCLGTPLRNDIEARDAARISEATDVAAEAIAAKFGEGAVEGKIQAHIVTLET